LNKNYNSLAVNENESVYDWSDSAYFASKGARATKGCNVQPENPNDWGIQQPDITELNNAYDTLQIALVVDKKKVTSPIAAAQAQASFDCWVEQSQEKFTESNSLATCRAAFYEAVCRMYKGATCPVSDTISRVFFATGSAVIDDHGQKTIAGALRDYRHGNATIVVTGHADRVGTPKNNLTLSKRRAEAVAARLIAGGVPAGKITQTYFGEGQPLVPTADGVPNHQNRRALIVVR
jgi:OOP family OmpA-OmpF porin